MRRALLVLVLVVLAGCQVPGHGSPAGEPETDQLGWENGYWYDDEISVTPENGFNQSELNATVARSMARVEKVRGLEFEQSVPVEVINRSTYRDQTGGNESEALQRFDNAKFEALFLVGEETASIEEQDENRGSTVAGYYSPSEDAIVIVSESERPTLSSERTLAHELVHALQDQHFDLGNSSARTRDAYQGRNGLVEGDASFTERRYTGNCGAAWSCISANTTSGGGGGGGDIHLGIYILQYFPYSEGPTFVESLHDRGGWDAVNGAYADLPDGATEVIEADRYPEWEPTNVSVGTVDADWERIEPPGRVNYGVLGQSAITAGLGYTLYDEYNEQTVVQPQEFLNVRPNGTVDFRQPFNYGIEPADGWAGDRFVAYQPADGDSDQELAYVWRSTWESEGDASEFADAWRRLITHWGGQQVAADTYRIPDGEYADAFRITVEGATVTVVNAPERSDLDGFSDV